MIELTCRLDAGTPHKTLTLSRDQRVRTRQRVTLDDGSSAGIFIDRGQVLHDGDLLGSNDGIVVRVRAARESVSVIRCDDALLTAKICYHLGNRHVALQIDQGMVCYQHDHVLDEMMRGFGLTPEQAERPFEPEPGAYGGHGHAGHHGH